MHFLRYEFQGRKTIHAHCVFRVIDGPSETELNLAFQEVPPAVSPEDAMKELGDVKADDPRVLKIMETWKNFTEVEAAKEKVIDFAASKMGISAVHPNPNPVAWPPPYGQTPFAPLVNPLRCDFGDIIKDERAILQNFERYEKIKIHFLFIILTQEFLINSLSNSKLFSHLQNTI